MKGNGPRVLVVDDEKAIRRFLRVSLSTHGYDVYEASNGLEAQSAVIASRPDAIILDLCLPDMDGIDVTRQLREWARIPIIILSVREGEQDKVSALDAGADDYLTKPFGNEELLARLRVAVRRSALIMPDEVFEIDQLKIDLTHRKVSLDGKEIYLTPTEYDLLRILVQEAGKVITHRQMLHRVWGPGYEDDTHLLRVTMSNLRRKIEKDATRPYYILTDPGVGYYLRLPK